MGSRFSFLILLLVSCLCLGSTFADDATEPAKGEVPSLVVSLNAEAFPKFINDGISIVMFFAPWCTHCQKLEPVYEEAAKTVLEKEIPVKFGRVDATAENELASQFDIKGYPTLLYFINGESHKYGGGRNVDDFLAWANKVTQDSVTVVAEDALEKTIENVEVAFIGRLKTGNEEAMTILKDVADAHIFDMQFFVVYSDSNENTLEAAYNGSLGGERIAIDDLEKVREFAKTEMFPYVGPINASNYSKYYGHSKEIAWFVGTEEDFNTHKEVLVNIGKTFRKSDHFVWLDYSLFKDHAENALGISKPPALVMNRESRRYLFEEDVSNLEAVKAFVQSVIDGVAEAHLLSEEIPESNDEAVKVVVGKTFESLVLKAEKDVFLEVYAPWCGHCQNFAPVYLEFAEANKSNTDLVVAKMDGTKNEVEHPAFAWRAFPTLYFMKANASEPILYDGEMTLPGLKAFYEKQKLPSDGTKDEL